MKGEQSLPPPRKEGELVPSFYYRRVLSKSLALTGMLLTKPTPATPIIPYRFRNSCYPRIRIFGMKSFQAALESLWLTPRRTLLSGLGMMVGVAAIVVLVSLAKGVRQEVVAQVESLGVNLVIVLPGRISPENPFNPMASSAGTLRESDMEVVRSLVGVRRVAPIMFVAGGASRGERWADAALILGTTPEWFQMRPHQLARGRFFTRAEMEQPVCILGPKPAGAWLFGDENPLGKWVRLNGKPFRVIGVTAESYTRSLFGSGGHSTPSMRP